MSPIPTISFCDNSFFIKLFSYLVKYITNDTPTIGKSVKNEGWNILSL